MIWTPAPNPNAHRIADIKQHLCCNRIKAYGLVSDSAGETFASIVISLDIIPVRDCRVQRYEIFLKKPIKTGKMCFRSQANQIFSHTSLAPTLLSFTFLLYHLESRTLTRHPSNTLEPYPSVWKIRPRLFDAHGSWRQHKNSSRVPRYQILKKIGGFCDFLFKPLTMWGEVW